MTSDETNKNTKKKPLLILAAVLVAIALLLPLLIVGLGTVKGPSAPEIEESLIKQSLTQAAEGNALMGKDEGENTAPVLVSGRVLGSKDALIKVVEYSSLTCGHCASFHENTLPDIKKKYISTEQVSFQFEDFPLNAPALQGALIARCLPKERYIGFVTLLFKTQEDWSSRPDYITLLKQNGKLAGLSEEQINSCLEDKVLRGNIAAEIKRATAKWNIHSTPTFIITGPEGEEILAGAQPLYEFERVFRKVSGGKVGTIEKENKE